jgi:lysozyme
MRSSDNRLRELLIKHEGIRLKPYKCPAGKVTIGCGRNLEDVGITDGEARLMLSNDIERIHKEANEFSWFKSLNMPRQDVVLNMLFNLGLPKFLAFRKMIEALRLANYDQAATEMLDSKWAIQVGIRAKELAEIMRTGRYL